MVRSVVVTASMVAAGTGLGLHAGLIDSRCALHIVVEVGPGGDQVVFHFLAALVTGPDRYP